MVIVSIDIGLLVGILLGVALLFFKGIRPYSCILGKVPGTELYLDTSRYKTAIEIDGIKIFHFCGCLNFCSKTIFKKELSQMVKTDVMKDIKDESNGTKATTTSLLQYLVLDFSALTYVDSSGVAFLKTLIKEYQKQSVSLFIAGSSCKIF